MTPRCQRGSTCSAAMTWLGSSAPEVQALPAETAMPSKSKRISNASESSPAKDTLLDVRQARCARAVDANVRYARRMPRSKRSRSRPTRCSALRSFRDGEFERRSESDDARDVLGPRAPPELLAAAVDERRQGETVAHVEHADAFGAVELVRGEREQIDAEVARPQRRSRPAACTASV